MLDLSLAELAQNIAAVILGLTVHEFAHSLMALRLGDDTPRRLGRLTLNPLRHIDPVGFLLLVTAGFGWARPVVIDRERLKRPVRDDILIALAGPLANLLLALLLTAALKLVLTWVPFATRGGLQAVFTVFITFIWINTGLAVFNLLPIPPLDGSHLLAPLLSAKSKTAAQAWFRYGSYLLLAVILLERVLRVELLPIGAAVRFLVSGLLRAAAIF
jgi:Zn-dependent protease